MTNKDNNDIPMLSMKKALMPILIIGGPVVLAALILIIPLIMNNLNDKDNNAAAALIVQLTGILLVFTGMILSRISKVKKRRLELELHSLEPEKKLNDSTLS